MCRQYLYQAALNSSHEMCKTSAGLQHECACVRAQDVEERDEVLRVEEGVGEGKAESRGNEAPPILHHPSTCLEVNTSRLAPLVQHRRTCVQSEPGYNLDLVIIK